MKVPMTTIRMTVHHLAYCIILALHNGIPLEKIKKMLVVHNGDFGLTEIRLKATQSETIITSRQMELHTAHTIYYVELDCTTCFPLSLEWDALDIQAQHLHKPCFRFASLGATLDGKKFCKIAASAAAPVRSSLTVTQQKRLLQYLLPDLPATSPFLAQTPELQMSFTSNVRFTVVKNEPLCPQIILTLWLHTPSDPEELYPSHEHFLFKTTLSAPFTPTGGLSQSLELTDPAIPAREAQTQLAHLQALFDIFTQASKWQLVIVPKNVYPLHRSARFLTNLMRYMSELRIDFGLHTEALPHSPNGAPPTEALEAAHPQVPPLSLFTATPDSSRVPNPYATYRKQLLQECIATSQQLMQQQLLC